MAACGMRGIRYISFPPIVFETPAPLAAPAEAEPLAEIEVAPMAIALALAEDPPPPAEPLPAAPPAVPPPVSAPPRMAPAEVAPPPRRAAASVKLRRLAEFAAVAEEEFVPAPRSGHSAEPEPMEVLTAPSAHHAPAAQGDDAPRPSFALLHDIAGEIRPRRVRARTGRGTADKSV